MKGGRILGPSVRVFNRKQNLVTKSEQANESVLRVQFLYFPLFTGIPRKTVKRYHSYQSNRIDTNSSQSQTPIEGRDR
jgi:hypothetical protein